MQAIRVIAPGLQTTVQDSGRIGYQDVGVPTSGPLDRVSFRLSNALVGNSRDTPALEMLIQGPTCEVLADSIRVALVGCGAAWKYVPENRAIFRPARRGLSRGTCRIGPLGDRSCLSRLEGVLDVPTVLGSASTMFAARSADFRGAPAKDESCLSLASVDDVASTRCAPLVSVSTSQCACYSVRRPITSRRCGATSCHRNTCGPGDRGHGFSSRRPLLRIAGGYDIVSDGTVP